MHADFKLCRNNWSRWIVSVSMFLVQPVAPYISTSHRAELLLEKGYEVHGIIRRSSSFNTGRLESLYADQHERTRPYRIV